MLICFIPLPSDLCLIQHYLKFLVGAVSSWSDVETLGDCGILTEYQAVLSGQVDEPNSRAYSQTEMIKLFQNKQKECI